MPRPRPSDLLAWAVATAVVAVGGTLLAGWMAPSAAPTLRVVFGVVLVLYGAYRVAAQAARRRADGDA